MVKVYAWYPWHWWNFALGQIKTETGAKTAGHATMSYSWGYVSFWSESIISTSFQKDCEVYGRLPHLEVTLVGLDESAIHAWWQKTRLKIRSGQIKHETMGYNCAYTVANALYAGLNETPIGSCHEWNTIWSPRSATQYAEAIRAYLARGGEAAASSNRRGAAMHRGSP